MFSTWPEFFQWLQTIDATVALIPMGGGVFWGMIQFNKSKRVKHMVLDFHEVEEKE